METAWYLLHIRPEPSENEVQEEPIKDEASPEPEEQKKAAEQATEEKDNSLRIPQVGTPVVYFLGAGPDEARSERDKKNVLWDKIQDEARPAWAPDLLRLGYAVVFKREGLPKLAARLGLRNPANVTKEEKERSKKRILTFDDVWAVGVVPHKMPMYFPDKDLDTENWWLSVREPGKATSPYIAPAGVTVATGAKRLADITVEMLRQPSGFPRIVPTLEEMEDDYSEFINPLVPIKPKSPEPTGAPDATSYRTSYDPETGYGWAGIELFRYGGT